MKRLMALVLLLTLTFVTACGADTEETKQKADTRNESKVEATAEPSSTDTEPSDSEETETSSSEESISQESNSAFEPAESIAATPTEEPTQNTASETAEEVDYPIPGAPHTLYNEISWLLYTESEYYNPDLVWEISVSDGSLYGELTKLKAEVPGLLYSIAYCEEFCSVMIVIPGEVEATEVFYEDHPTIQYSSPYTEAGVHIEGARLAGGEIPPITIPAGISYSDDFMSEVYNRVNDYCCYSGEIFFGCSLDEAMDEMSNVSSYATYEVLSMTDPKENYPFRVSVVVFDGTDTYVVTESIQNICIFRQVPAGDTNYDAYTYHLGDEEVFYEY